MIRPANIVVCGAGFGAAWLAALRADPRRFAIAALLARGSVMASRTAAQHHTSLIGSPGDVRDRPDAVVVAVGGSEGADLAAAWLRQGTPVLIEHPVSASDIRRLHRSARAAGVPMHVNTHFADLEVYRRFLRRCRNLAAKAPPELLMAVATRRTLYSVLDLCMRALDAGDINVVSRLVDAPLAPVFSLRAGATPVSLQILPRCSACDDGTDMLGGHRITACYPERQVGVEGPAGPVVELAAPGHDSYVWRLHAERTTWLRYHTSMRTAALRRSLHTLLAASRGRDIPEQRARRIQSLAGAWETMLAQLPIKTPASS